MEYFLRIKLNQSKRAFSTSLAFPNLLHFTQLTEGFAAHLTALLFDKPYRNPLVIASFSFTSLLLNEDIVL